jgi:acetyl esterase
MSLRQTLEIALARTVFNLPPAWLVRLSGRDAIELDGQRLHPEMQLILASRRWSGAPPSLRAAEIGAARKAMLFGCTRYADAPKVGRVREHTIEGPAGGRIRMRHYAPTSNTARPLLLFFHGGGFALGDLDSHDLPCRLMCREADLHVLSVDYRLAPEHPFPAAHEDAYAALQWARANAPGFGADAARIAVGGDSAGGNLAAVLAQRIARSNEPPLAAQVLVYPVVDRINPRASHELFAEGFMLEREDMRWFDDMYAPAPLRSDPRVSPALAPDLSCLPPAIVVTAGFDPLRDEGEAYVEALRAAGSKVTAWREPGFLHGFMNCAGVSRASRRSVKRIAAELRAFLD